ncbi:ATP-binding protein [Paractinoplanes durhamensis]
MTSADIARLADERRGVDWSAAETDSPVSTASPVAMAQARALLRQHQDPQRRSYATYDDADLLRALGVATADGRLLNAGRVLFCDPDPAFPAEELLVYQYRRSPGGEPAEIARLSQPLISAYLRIQEHVEARVDKTPLLLPDGQQVYLADLPEAAVREAVANAVIHRDYRSPGPVHVEHAPTQLVVTSPGPLVQGVTVDNILSTPSRPRNFRLTAAVRVLGLAEQAGVGVERMYREMIRLGHQPPQIREDWGSVRVSLLGGAPNKAIARYVASLPEEYADDADAMLVLFALLSKRTVTAEQLTPVLQKPIDEVAGVLRKLDGDDVAMVEPTRETIRRRYPTYRLREQVIRELGAAVGYRRRTQDDIDRKVIEAVQEIGQITGKMVQLLLDVDGSRASRILADLVDRQLLIKTSHQQRGPGVTYGPGPRFPLRKGRRRSVSSKPGADRVPVEDQPEQQELFTDDV